MWKKIVNNNKIVRDVEEGTCHPMFLLILGN